MFWDKKENKRSLPDLPPVKSNFSMQDDEFEALNEKHDLPAFPDSPMKRGFSQSAIKDAVSTNDEDSFKTEEIDESTSNSHQLSSPPVQSRVVQKTTDVFVKIEKYQSARKALSTAQDKMLEIDELLRKIRETRMREDQELAAWEKEVVSAKTKIQEVSQNLFDRA